MFKLFLDNNVLKSKAELSEFPKDERLDDLYFDILGVSKFKKLVSIVSLVLTLSHGQASVECGFSQNNSVLQSVSRHNNFETDHQRSHACK